MSVVKMHENEVETDVSLVRRLLAAQFPDWSTLPIMRIKSAGTDNAIYRLGDDMAVRLPRIDWAVGQVDKEHAWLPRLAPHLPLTIPVPLAKGTPGEGYPWHWSVYRWLEGKNATLDHIADSCQAATKLAEFLIALQQLDTTDGLPAAEYNIRGMPLMMRDVGTRKSIAELSLLIDTDVATAIWDAAIQKPAWGRVPVWFHGDLMPGNLLFQQGCLRAVIDFGGLAVGDPACDLMIAWGLFSGKSREAFRTALGVDDATWARGRGHALSQAVICIPYYLHTNPVAVATAQHTLNEIFIDFYENG